MKKFRKCKMEIKIIIFILFSTIIFIGCETDDEKANKIFSENVVPLGNKISEGINTKNVEEISLLLDKVYEITTKYPQTLYFLFFCL